jgi:sulfite exporter TauE/SafE
MLVLNANSLMQCNDNVKETAPLNDRRPSFFALLGLFALVIMIGSLLSRLGLFHANFAVNGTVGFFSALAIGLVAASSSCMAVSGGLLLATAAKFNEQRAKTNRSGSRLAPVLLFVSGRVVSYAVFGGIIGAIGKTVSVSPFVSGAITVAAALVMLALGLDMLKLLPKWIKKLTPSMPAFISRRVMNADSSMHPAAPMVIGAGTFFLPCGFTQAFQLYALASGSFAAGALVMGAFALGTVPALVALGWFAGSWKGKSGRFFFRLAGAAVIILGIINFRNGYSLMGLPVLTYNAGAADPAGVAAADDGQTQTIGMAIGASGYSPDSFTLRAGEPTRWTVDATNASGCQMGLVSRSLGINKTLAAGENVIEFTAPAEPGTYQFSCPMGMYRGQINVVAS